nr:MAG TPA: hypothetical protein [Caudoviricetes sp.]
MTKYASYGKITEESCTVLTIGGLLLERGGDKHDYSRINFIINFDS